MTTELMTEMNVREIVSTEQAMKEYSVVIDGVVEMPENLDPKSFFDGLLDAIIEYVEKHNAFAGLSMSHKEYVEDNDNEDLNDEQAA
ncbi:MAG: hypothetical protein ACOYYU_08280 [Chloroflexota bacterium]